MAITSAEVHKIMQHLSRTVDLLISRLRLHLQKKYLVFVYFFNDQFYEWVIIPC